MSSQIVGEKIDKFHGHEIPQTILQETLSDLSYITGIFLQNATANITSTTFVGNAAGGNGGAVSFVQSLVDFVNCTFDANLSQLGGALYFKLSTSAHSVDDCTFIYNQVRIFAYLLNCTKYQSPKCIIANMSEVDELQVIH